MKVLFINSLDRRYGSTYRLRKLYESLTLPDLEKTYIESNSESAPPYVSVRQADTLWGYFAASVKRAKMAAVYDYDIMVTQKFIPLTILHMAIAKLRRKKVIVDWDDLDAGLQKGSLRKLIVSICEKVGPYLADHVTTHSKVIRDLAERVYGRKTTLVAQGADFSLFDPALYDPEEAKKKLGVSGKKVLGCLCTLTTGGAKDIDVLFELARKLKESGIEFFLLIIGGGPLEAATREMAAKYGVQSETIVTGLVAQGDIPEYLAALDASLVYMRDDPSNRARVSLKVLESLAMNKPVVGHLVGESKDRFGEFVVQTAPDPDEFRSRLLDVLNGIRRCTGAREKLSREFSWDIIGKKFGECIERIAGRR